MALLPRSSCSTSLSNSSNRQQPSTLPSPSSSLQQMSSSVQDSCGHESPSPTPHSHLFRRNILHFVSTEKWRQWAQSKFLPGADGGLETLQAIEQTKSDYIGDLQFILRLRTSLTLISKGRSFLTYFEKLGNTWRMDIFGGGAIFTVEPEHIKVYIISLHGDVSK